MTNHAVVIAGGGPTGMMLAGELALAKVDVVVVERRTRQEVDGTRAGGLHARSIELLDQRGIADRFLAEGKIMQIAGLPMIPLAMHDLPTRHAYGLALGQAHIERLLAGWVEELGVPVRRAAEITGVSAGDHGAAVQLANGERIEGQYLVGCDGGRSLVRKRAGIGFPGWDASVSYLIAEAQLAEEPPWGMRPGERGMNGIGKLEDGKGVRIVLSEPDVVKGPAPTEHDLRAALRALYGSDFGVHTITWLSRFTDATRQADAYRKGSVLLAGDAAHVHAPTGGQGLNPGMHDAVNLGFKLAQVVRGISPTTLLDTYHAERHPVTARILRATMAMAGLQRGDERTVALRENLAELFALDEPRRRYAAMLSGLDVRYSLGEGHPLVGRRIPDLDLVTDGGPRRLFSLLHDARPLLLDLGAGVDPGQHRVRYVRAQCEGAWELPAFGPVPAPGAVLVRPDGHVAWAGGDGLAEALATWCGA